VLLIDLSASTFSKRGLIRQTTRRSIEAARPSDRLAIVTFSHSQKIISTLTSNPKQLFETVEKATAARRKVFWLCHSSYG
jgi:hypothetical protein